LEAAVALVLAGGPELSLCLIRRSEREDDPWSGHMALPGGRASLNDPHPEAVAERETLEEVGLAIGESHRLGALSHVLVRLGGGDHRMVLSPFVYYLGPDLLPFAPIRPRWRRRSGSLSPTSGTRPTPTPWSGS